MEDEIIDILKDPELYTLITVNELNKFIAEEISVRQAIFLNACGKFVKNASKTSYNLCINSNSGSGKDHITSKVLGLFYEYNEKTKQGTLIHRTRISPTVFNYWHMDEPGYSWDGKILFLSDISAEVLNHEVFKVMVSEGSRATIVIQQRAKDIHIPGKPVTFITTAESIPNSENLRRFPMTYLDESIEQTKRILQFQADSKEDEKYDPLIQKGLNSLKPVAVSIPFKTKILNEFPIDNVISRTNYKRFIDLIKASASLHQFQRKSTPQGEIIATGKDYDIARDVLITCSQNALMIPVVHQHKEILDLCVKLHNEYEWIYPPIDIANRIHQNELWVYRTMVKLKPFFDVKSISTVKFYDEREDLFDSENHARKIKKPWKVYRLKNYTAIYINQWSDIINDEY